MYGHPDHVAISQLTATAVVAAADPGYQGLTGGTPHRVAKMYYRAFLPAEQKAYEATFGRLAMPVDSVERRCTAWPEWAITTRIDTPAYWGKVWQAIACHRSQLPGHRLDALPGEERLSLLGTQTYYRAMSLVNGGRALEDDLFAGLRGRYQAQWRIYEAQPRVAA